MRVLVLTLCGMMFMVGLKSCSQSFPVRFSEPIYYTELDVLPNGNIVEYQMIKYKKVLYASKYNSLQLTRTKVLLHKYDTITTVLYDSHENYNLAAYVPDGLTRLNILQSSNCVSVNENGDFYFVSTYQFQDFHDTTRVNTYSRLIGFNQNGHQIFERFGDKYSIATPIEIFDNKLYFPNYQYGKLEFRYYDLSVVHNQHAFKLKTPFPKNSTINYIKKISEDSLMLALVTTNDSLPRGESILQFYYFDKMEFLKSDLQRICNWQTEIYCNPKTQHIYIQTQNDLTAYKNGVKIYDAENLNIRSADRVVMDDGSVCFFKNVRSNKSHDFQNLKVTIVDAMGNVKEKVIGKVKIPITNHGATIHLGDNKFLTSHSLHIPTSGCLPNDKHGNVLFKFGLNNLPNEVKENKKHNEFYGVLFEGWAKVNGIAP